MKMKMKKTIHSYPHISQFGAGEREKSRDEILKIHNVMKLNLLSVVLSFNNF